MGRFKNGSVEGEGLFDVEEVSALAGYDPNATEPPAEWPDFSNGIEPEFCCPSCRYQWRGVAMPTEKDVEVEN